MINCTAARPLSTISGRIVRLSFSTLSSFFNVSMPVVVVVGVVVDVVIGVCGGWGGDAGACLFVWLVFSLFFSEL